MALDHRVISEKLRTSEVATDPNANLSVQEADATQTKGATFKMNSTKIYVPAITLPKDDCFRFLENIRQGFKRTIFLERI